MKQVIVLREDLGMSTGKMIAQACHASLASYQEAKKTKKEWVSAWEMGGQKKVVLRAGNVELIKELQDKAKKLKLPTALIKDAGFTEILPGSITALAIGPAPDESIDKVTGFLPLLKELK